jgi:galactokinase
MASSVASPRETVVQTFQQMMGKAPPLLVSAPGRVNIIGDHTDYNDGFVLPMAIDRAIWIAFEPLDTPHVEILMLDDSDSHESSLVDLTTFEKGGSTALEYVRGVAWALHEDGLPLKGWRGVVQGDVPIGAGLSSSAALELAVARAFAAVSGFDWDPVHMAQLCQKAENVWVGVNTGIMDQLISATGQAGKAMLIDCRSLGLTSAPLPSGTVLVVLDTNTRRGLVSSKYGERREQCEAAAQFFDVPALRDVSVEQFNQRAHELDDVIRKRARHVITENDRTIKAAKAMQAGEVEILGSLMNESHTSMRDDFENSTDAMDAIVTIAQVHDTCYGARMTGGGFGGGAVALVSADDVDAFMETVTSKYVEHTGIDPMLYVCHPTDGASLIGIEDLDI